MTVKDAILSTGPTSYWPLDDVGGAICNDAMGLHNASVPAQGVDLAVIPFGASQAPFFDGALGSYLTIDDDPKYSQPYANALTVGAWICPLALDNANTTGTTDQYVHFVEKAVGRLWLRLGRGDSDGKRAQSSAEHRTHDQFSQHGVMYLRGLLWRGSG